MPTYEFRCPEHGAFDEVMRLGSAPPEWACPSCGRLAGRAFTVPFVRSPKRELYSAIEKSEKSAWEPEVVSSIPGRGAKNPVRWATDPRLQGLPRP